jgi:hypothetical protein
MLCFPRTLLAAAFTLSVLPSALLRAEDWPQWRGPNRDGVCCETGLLESFPAQGLKVRWRVPVGWGWSSPVVAQGRVYLADSEVVKPRPSERLHCFDEATGKALWTHAYEVAYPDWAFDPTQESGPVATPIVQDGKVYTLGRLGHLCGLDARKGEVLWQKNLEKDYQVVWSPGTPSPLIEGELLILLIGGKPGACVVAFHKDTGKEVWRALEESLTFSSPIVITSGGKRQTRCRRTLAAVENSRPQNPEPYLDRAFPGRPSVFRQIVRRTGLPGGEHWQAGLGIDPGDRPEKWGEYPPDSER